MNTDDSKAALQSTAGYRKSPEKRADIFVISVSAKLTKVYNRISQ
jgi:hypothetical protein